MTDLALWIQRSDPDPPKSLTQIPELFDIPICLRVDHKVEKSIWKFDSFVRFLEQNAAKFFLIIKSQLDPSLRIENNKTLWLM